MTIQIEQKDKQSDAHDFDPKLLLFARSGYHLFLSLRSKSDHPEDDKRGVIAIFDQTFVVTYILDLRSIHIKSFMVVDRRELSLPNVTSNSLMNHQLVQLTLGWYLWSRSSCNRQLPHSHINQTMKSETVKQTREERLLNRFAEQQLLH
jgi:hypothetical protein